MSLEIVNITINTAQPRKLAEWWVTATGGTINHDFEEFVFATVGNMGLGFQRSDTEGAAKIHIDFAAEDRDAEVVRLTELGAVFVAEHEVPGAAWTVLADPDGNQFCVSQKR
jgi:predicted enzyme related to lactoylglutathione lyase